MTNEIGTMIELVEKASSVELQEYVGLIRDVAESLKKESGNVGKLEVTGKLVRLPLEGEATVIGDIHGDMDSLVQILKTSDFLSKASSGKQPLLIFLGDYGDRGMQSPEVYYGVLTLKKRFPENVILMRGNHEGPEDLQVSPHDLPFNLQERFGDDSSNAYLALKELFDQLYTATIVEERCVFLHGGVPSQAKRLDDVAYAHTKHPSESHLEEILWSDPAEGIKGTSPSPRGAGRLFGEDVTEKFLRMLKVNVLIRGHEPCDAGFKMNHSGRVLTLFSRTGEPYFNSHGAFLQFDLARPIKDAFELQRFVKQV